jgi:hypothetical protein
MVRVGGAFKERGGASKISGLLKHGERASSTPEKACADQATGFRSG